MAVEEEVMKVIYVAKENESHLSKAWNWAAGGAVGGAASPMGADLYKKVKEYLTKNNVPHRGAKSVDDVPKTGHSYVEVRK